MSGLRWVVLVSVLVLAAAAGAVAMTSRGEEHEGAGDPDRDAEAHVASRHGYEQRNAVKVFATAAAAGWAGEAKLAVEDTWEPHIAADPSAPYVYAVYNRYGVSCPKSSQWKSRCWSSPKWR